MVIIKYTALTILKSGVIFSLFFLMSSITDHTIDMNSNVELIKVTTRASSLKELVKKLLFSLGTMYFLTEEAECTGGNGARKIVGECLVGIKQNTPKTLAETHVQGAVIQCKNPSLQQPTVSGKISHLGDGFTMRQDQMPKTGCGTIHCVHDCPITIIFNTTTYDSTKGSVADARAHLKNIGEYSVLNKLEGTYRQPGENPNPNCTKSQGIIIHSQETDITLTKKDYHQCEWATNYFQKQKYSTQHLLEAYATKKANLLDREEKRKRLEKLKDAAAKDAKIAENQKNDKIFLLTAKNKQDDHEII